MDKSGGSIKKIRGFLFTLVNKEAARFLQEQLPPPSLWHFLAFDDPQRDLRDGIQNPR